MNARIDYETPKQYKGRLARNMLKGVLRNQGPALLSSRRFSAPDIDPGIE